MKSKLTFAVLFIITLSCSKKEDPKILGSLTIKDKTYQFTSGKIIKLTKNARFDKYEIRLSAGKNTFVELLLTSPHDEWISSGTYVEGEPYKAFRLSNLSMVGIEFKQTKGSSYDGRLYLVEGSSSYVRITGSHGLRTIDGIVNGEEYLTGDVADITFSFSGAMKEYK